MITHGRYGEIKNAKLHPSDGPLNGPITTYQLTPKKLAKYQKEGTESMGTKIPAPSTEKMVALIKEHHGSINAIALAKHVSWGVVRTWLKELGLEEMTKDELRRHKESASKNLEDLKKLAADRNEPLKTHGGYEVAISKSIAPERPPKDIIQKMVDNGAKPRDIAVYFGWKTAQIVELMKEYEISFTPQPMKAIEKEDYQEKPLAKDTDAGAMIYFANTNTHLEFTNLQDALQHIEDNCSKNDSKQISLYKKVPFSFGVNVVPGQVK